MSNWKLPTPCMRTTTILCEYGVPTSKFVNNFSELFDIREYEICHFLRNNITEQGVSDFIKRNDSERPVLNIIYGCNANNEECKSCYQSFKRMNLDVYYCDNKPETVSCFGRVFKSVDIDKIFTVKAIIHLLAASGCYCGDHIEEIKQKIIDTIGDEYV